MFGLQQRYLAEKLAPLQSWQNVCRVRHPHEYERRSVRLELHVLM